MPRRKGKNLAILTILGLILTVSAVQAQDKAPTQDDGPPVLSDPSLEPPPQPQPRRPERMIEPDRSNQGRYGLWELGGRVAFSFEHQRYNDAHGADQESDLFSLQVSPEFAAFISDELQIGFGLPVQYRQFENLSDGA